MSSNSVVYTYPQTLFTSVTPTGIDSADLYGKSHALNYASAVFFDITSDLNNNTGIIDYYFTYESALNQDDKNALDAFVTNYIFVPRVEVCVNVRETKSTGVNAGTFTANVWTIRKFNEFIGAQVFATIDNNQITLNPGNYIIIVKATSVNVGNTKVRIKNITDGTYAYGPNVFSTGDVITTSDIHHFYSVYVTTTIQIEQICQTTVADIGLGKAIGFGLDEVYSQVFIHQTQSF